LHYCGGEIEKVNFVIKGSTACCGEEEDSEPMDDGCCKDEKIVIKNQADFTLKQINNDITKRFCEVFYICLPFLDNKLISEPKLNKLVIEPPPPKLQASLVISTSVLRI